MRNEFDWAWLAGFMDGEGYFGLITRIIGKKRIYPQVQIQVSQKDELVIGWIHQNWGGRIDTPGENYWRVSWTNQKDVARMCRGVLPYLKVKKNRAELLLSYCEMRLRKRASGIKEYDEEDLRIIDGLWVRGRDGIGRRRENLRNH